jgi:hypothetical protein
MSSFCLGCGNSMAAGERFCGICGKDSLATASPAVDPGVAFGLPPETSGKAILSLVGGVLFLILPFALVGVIFGHWSLSEIRKSAGRLRGRGLAIAGLVLGYLGVAAMLALIVATISWRPMRRSMAEGFKEGLKEGLKTANENSVVSSVRTLNTAEIAYAQAHRESGYTCSFSELSDAWGLSGDLSHGRKNGYIFELQGCSATKANGPIAKYQLVAYPAVTNKAGKPAFCSNESDVIKVARSGSPQDCLRAGVDLSENEINHPQSSSTTIAH